jgi:preprotein translocase subunit SecE
VVRGGDGESRKDLGATAKAMAEEIGSSTNFLDQVRTYFGEVRSEMRRVTWPSKQEIYGITVMVILTTFIFGAYFYATDHLFQFVVGRILKHFIG